MARVGDPDQYGGQTPAVGTRRPRGWYPEPRDRDTGRRRPPTDYGPEITNRVGIVYQGYPDARARVEVAPEFDEVYDRQDGAINTALGPGGGLTATFSGVPDSVDISCGANGQVLLFDQNGIQIGPSFVVPAGTPYTTNLMARSAQVFNLGAAAAPFSIIGKWRRPLPVEPRQADIGAPR